MKCILLIDDSVASALLTQTLFKRKGAKVLIALNVKQGLYLAKTYIPDLIVLDYMLLEEKAFELFYALRKSEQMKDIPILVLLEHWDKELIQQCTDCGVNKILIKPVEEAQLLDTVADLLGIPVRKAVRIGVELEVVHESPRGQHKGRTENISETGMLLMTPVPLDLHDIIELHFSLPNDPEPFYIYGEVVREQEMPHDDIFAFGIHFIEMKNKERERLKKFIESQLNPALSESA